MKKIRKGKKMLLILLAVAVVIIAIVLIVNIVNKPGQTGIPEDKSVIISLPETTYSDMEVRNIEMEYLKDNNETMVTMEIYNTTANIVEKENLYAMLIGADESIIGKIQTYIKQLSPGEQYDISVILKGDLTSATQIKLIKK